MNTIYVIVAAIILYAIAYASWLGRGSNSKPIIVFVVGISIVWAAILGVAWFVGGSARFHNFVLVFLGYVIGMIAMYIAMHVYRS